MKRSFNLEVEGEGARSDVPFAVVEQALARIDLAGPSFFILTDSTGSYVQIAGARLRLTVEYRQNNRFGFRHFVLGKPAENPAEISINYSGGPITIRSNEVLTVREAVEVFKSFYEKGSVPEAFSKRETTEMFK